MNFKKINFKIIRYSWTVTVGVGFRRPEKNPRKDQEKNKVVGEIPSLLALQWIGTSQVKFN